MGSFSFPYRSFPIPIHAHSHSLTSVPFPWYSHGSPIPIGNPNPTVTFTQHKRNITVLVLKWCGTLTRRRCRCSRWRSSIWWGLAAVRAPRCRQLPGRPDEDVDPWTSGTRQVLPSAVLSAANCSRRSESRQETIGNCRHYTPSTS